MNKKNIRKKLNFISQAQKKEEEWKTTAIEHCKYCKEKTVIYIKADVLAKISYLAKHCDTEVACELLGNAKDNIIDEIYIFPQEVTAGSVKRIVTNNMPKNIEKDLVGMLHFHPGHAVENYTTRFSNIDEQGGNLNYKVNIVAIRCNNILGFNLYAEVYIVPECRKMVITEAEIKILQEKPQNLDNIKIKKPDVPNLPSYYHYYTPWFLDEE